MSAKPHVEPGHEHTGDAGPTKFFAATEASMEQHDLAKTLAVAISGGVCASCGTKAITISIFGDGGYAFSAIDPETAHEIAAEILSELARIGATPRGQ
jgi:hypothetical protein